MNLNKLLVGTALCAAATVWAPFVPAQIASKADPRVSAMIYVNQYPDPVVTGQPVSISIEIEGYNGAATGTVALYYGEVQLGSANVSGSGAYISLPTEGVLPGSYELSAAYSGDSNYPPSTVQFPVQVANKIATTTALSTGSSEHVVGDTIALQAQVSYTSTGAAATGSVTFSSPPYTLGVSPISSTGLATLSFPTSGVPAGNYAVTATYSGDANFASSASPPITESLMAQSPTSMTLYVSSTEDPVAIPVGTTVVIDAYVAPTISGSNPPAGSVVLSVDGNTFTTLPLIGGSASIDVSAQGLSVGSYKLIASYAGDVTDGPSSAEQYVEIVPGSSIAASASPNPVPVGTTTTFLSATVSGLGAPGTPTGEVYFDLQNGGGGECVLNGDGVCQLPLNTSSLSAGEYVVTVYYSGDSTFALSTATFTLVVQ